MRHTAAEVPEGAETVPEIMDNDPYPYKMRDIATMLVIHRVTLLRMLQAGRIKQEDGSDFQPKWRKRPIPHRVFSTADFEVIKKAVDAMAPKDREYVDAVVTLE